MIKECEQLLNKIGFSMHHNGYRYICCAILILSDNPSYLKNLNKYLYPIIANHYNVSVSSVERCIRISIESAWLNGDMEFNNHLFKDIVHKDKGKPTNIQFLSFIYYSLLCSSISNTNFVQNSYWFHQIS